MIDVENGNECVICYEFTMNKTICDHIICKICITKLDKCAVCRKAFPHVSQEAIDELNIRIRHINHAILYCCISTSFGMLMIVVFLILYYQIEHL